MSSPGSLCAVEALLGAKAAQPWWEGEGLGVAPLIGAVASQAPRPAAERGGESVQRESRWRVSCCCSVTLGLAIPPASLLGKQILDQNQHFNETHSLPHPAPSTQ